MIRPPPASTLFPYTPLSQSNRLKFFRTQGNVTMDTAGVERVDFNALGGADLVTVNDLTGTRSDEHTAELQSRLHVACRLLLANHIVVNATNGDDTIDVTGVASFVWTRGDGTDTVDGFFFF